MSCAFVKPIWIALLALVLLGSFTLSPQAASAAPRECGFEALDPEIPEYARAGGMIEIPVNDYSGGETEYTGTVQVTPLGGASRVYPLEVTERGETSSGTLKGRVVVPAPEGRSRATQVVMTWIEKDTYVSGYTVECSAGDAATIPIVPPGGEVGDPSVPRLDGRYRINYRLVASGIPGADRSARGVWRFRPRCRYFGCPTRLRSSLGLRDTFAVTSWTDRHDYFTIRSFGRRGFCGGTIVNRFTGETIRRWKIRRAYKASQEITLRITAETSAGRATAFEGKAVLHIEPIASAERRGCPHKYVVERIRGHLIRS
ncbi:MAG TPA: hypothetical protein VFT79_08820 [Solirubrobacterales bacterium]|nr:hypothetical protein [Solirubrobacterales bacterium]